MYRSSRQSYQQQQQEMFQNQQWSQIIAHYEIQVQLEHKKLRQMQKSHRHKVQQLQKRIKQQSIQRQLANSNMATTNEPLQLQIQSRRRQIQLLTMKLQQLKKSPQLRKFTTIDQLLIPSPMPQIQIQQKHKQLRQLQNDLIQAENIFQGKYVIEHKLINQYEMELKMNKKLGLELDQRRKMMGRDYNGKGGQKIRKRWYQVNQYKRVREKLVKEMDQIRERIRVVEGENIAYTKSYSNEDIQPDEILKTSTIQNHQSHHRHLLQNTMRHKIFGSQLQYQNQPHQYNQIANHYSNKNINPSHNIKLQTLQIQNLQSKLQNITQANQQLLNRKQQRLLQLHKIKQLNQLTENEKDDVILGVAGIYRDMKEVRQSQKIVKEKQIENNYRQRVSWGKVQQQQNSIERTNNNKQNQTKQQQPQGLLQSVVKFFRNFNNQKKSQNLQAIQRERQRQRQSQNLQQSIIKPFTGRDTLASSALLNRLQSPSPNQHMQRQQFQQPPTYRNSTPQQNKYNMFGLEQIYKKNTPKTQPQ